MRLPARPCRASARSLMRSTRSQLALVQGELFALQRQALSLLVLVADFAQQRSDLGIVCSWRSPQDGPASVT